MKQLYVSVLIALSMLMTVCANSQVPIYSSYPTARPVIFLDFDGHTVSGTSWNGGGTIYCGPANLNATQITEVFNRVAEDYRPFAVNVTTDSTLYWAADPRSRMRVILTITNSWYGNVGGVAYIGSYTWGDNTPCFVFTALFGGNAKYLAEAASHEAGHTFGLRHQAKYDEACVKKSDYHDGKGSGETGWAPIMGVGYYQNFTVWNTGPTASGCNVIQNDLDVIASGANGFTFRPDDHANTFTDASTATLANNQFNISGVVGRTDDIDIFKFTLDKKGQFILNGIPYNVGSKNSGSDLDIQVDLLDASQTLLHSYNPYHALSTIADTILNAGTYYLRVDGTGNENTTEYGSLGAYSLQGNVTDLQVLPLHKLQLKGIAGNEKHQLTWEVVADEAIIKQQVEFSTDGRTFQSSIEASATSRSVEVTPATAGTIYYRLNVTFDNNKQYYSNMITLRSNNLLNRPRLITTWVRTNTLQVNSPYPCQYTIADYNGRAVLQGNLKEGLSYVTVSTVSQGAYIIYFKNDQTQFVEKFVKQ